MKINKFVVNLLMLNLDGNNRRRRKKFKINDFKGMKDVPYIDDNNVNHQFDVFFADESNKKNICIIDIHGGSYIFGHHRDNFIFGYEFLEKGYDFVAIDYVPNNGKKSVKDSIGDCVTCLNFIFKHLKELHLENDRFILAGDSAGGHFALLIKEMSEDKKIAEKLGFDLGDIKFELLLVNCPVYDFANIGSGILSKSGFMRILGPEYNNKKALEAISPKSYFNVLKGPIFVSTCKRDFLRNETLDLVKDAKKYNIPLEFIDVNTDDRRVEHVHNVVRPSLHESKYVNQAMMDFIYKNM